MPRLLDFAQSLMNTPTAPFREAWMLETLDRLLGRISGLQVIGDEFDNRWALLPGEAARPPLVMVAHLDHPGFVFEQPITARALARVEATFEGGVNDDYSAGAPVRLFRSADDPGVPGIVIEADSRQEPQHNRRVVIEVREPVENPVLAMWDFPGFQLEGDILHGRVCDDLVGVAIALSVLDRLAGEPAASRPNVLALLTRAEEAGFCGALCALETETAKRLLPRDAQIVSIEISSARAWAPLGGGGIVRVGDRTSLFDAWAVARLWKAATDSGREVRRALMDGGTCEATVFCAAGYAAAGVCAPVENYHNMDVAAGVIAPERVAVSDVMAVEEVLFRAALLDEADVSRELQERLAQYRETGRRRLR